MKREFMASAALAAGSLFMAAHPTEAAPQAAPVAASAPEGGCAPIYDQTASDKSAALEKAIGTYAAHNITVDVRVLNNGSADGINNQGALEKYQQSIVNNCGWTNRNTLGIAVTLNPKLYNFHETGNTGNIISTSDIQSKAGDFVDDLKSSSNYQTDVAEFLTELEPASGKTKAQAPPETVPPLQQAAPAPEHHSNLPWGDVLGGIGGVLVLGLGGARLKRGSTVRKIRNSTETLIAGTQKDYKDTMEKAEQAIESVPKDDVVDLRKYQADAQEEYQALQQRVTDFQSTAKKEASRLWPNSDTVSWAARKARSSANAAKEALTKVQDGRTEYENALLDLDTLKSEGLPQAYYAVRQAVDDMKAQGWDLGDYSVSAASYDNVQDRLNRMVDNDHYVVKAARYANKQIEELGELAKAIQALPDRRSEADDQLAHEAIALSSLQSESADVATIVADLKNRYHSSCYEDVEDLPDTIARQYAKLSDMYAKAKEGAGQKSAASVIATEKAATTIAKQRGDIESSIQQVTGRNAQLEELVTELPTSIEGLSGDITELQSSIEQWGKDVKRATKGSINSLADDISTLSEIDFHDLKSLPLFDIKQKTNELFQKMQRLEVSARKDHTRAEEEREARERARYSYNSGGTRSSGNDGFLTGLAVGEILEHGNGDRHDNDFGGGWGGGSDFGGGFGGGGDFGGGWGGGDGGGNAGGSW